jgi:hypothetical protein
MPYWIAISRAVLVGPYQQSAHNLNLGFCEIPSGTYLIACLQILHSSGIQNSKSRNPFAINGFSCPDIKLLCISLNSILIPHNSLSSIDSTLQFLSLILLRNGFSLVKYKK